MIRLKNCQRHILHNTNKTNRENPSINTTATKVGVIKNTARIFKLSMEDIKKSK